MSDERRITSEESGTVCHATAVEGGYGRGGGGSGESEEARRELAEIQGDLAAYA